MTEITVSAITYRLTVRSVRGVEYEDVERFASVADARDYVADALYGLPTFNAVRVNGTDGSEVRGTRQGGGAWWWDTVR